MAVVHTDPLKPKVGNKTSGDLVRALHSRHSQMGDVCLTEVSLGSSGKRADFYALRASWSNSLPTCYEIKVTKQDFKRDTKWPNYLPYCERFYFACPTGLISPERVSKEAGLVWVDDRGIVSIIKNSPNRQMEQKYKVAMMKRLLLRYMWNKGSLVQPDREPR